MLRQILTIVCLLVGIGLILAGVTWRHLFPPESYWTGDQAAEYVEASRALKAAAMREGRRADDPPDRQLAEAQSRFDTIKADLDRAIAVRSHAGTFLVAVGIALVIGAVWLHGTAPVQKMIWEASLKRNNGARCSLGRPF